MKPEQRVVLLQHRTQLLVGSNEVNNLSSDFFDYGGSDGNNYDDAR